MQMFLNHPSVQKMIGRPDLILNMWHNHQDLITGEFCLIACGSLNWVSESDVKY